MATTPTPERQWPLVALVDLGVDNVGAGNGVTVYLPPNTFVRNIAANVVTAFNTAGTGTMTVSASDGTTTFISAENAKATAGTNVTVDVNSKFFPSGGTITFSLTETLDTDAATAGRVMAAVEYVVLSRSNEVQG